MVHKTEAAVLQLLPSIKNLWMMIQCHATDGMINIAVISSTWKKVILLVVVSTIITIKAGIITAAFIKIATNIK